MKRIFLSAVAICAVVLGSSAHATKYQLTATGTVSTITSLYVGNPTPIPPTVINIGDLFTATVSFDTSKATVGALYDADPTTNVYYLDDTSVTVKIGAYTSTFSPPTYFGNSTMQIWNDRPVVGLTDSQSFSFYDYPTDGPYPFDLPGPRKQENLSVYLFDFTHTARSNDLISQIAPVSAFASKLLEYSFNSYDAAGNDQRFNLVRTSGVAMTLTAVPEPESWALMIGGFGLVGASARHRSARSRTSLNLS